MIYLAVTGPPRCGTTAMMHLLNKDPRILILMETLCFIKESNYTWEDIRIRHLFLHAPEETNDLGTYVGMRYTLEEKGVDPVTLRRHIHKGVNGHQLMDLLYAMSNSEVQVVGDKSPDIYLPEAAYQQIMSQPNTKMLLLLRDPLDSMASCYRNAAASIVQGLPLNYWMSTDLAILEQHWIDRMEAFLRIGLQDTDRIMIAKYEDVIENKAKFASRLLPFLGLTDHPAIGRDCSYASVNRGSWNTTIPEVLNKVSQRFKDLMYKCGYGEEVISNGVQEQRKEGQGQEVNLLDGDNKEVLPPVLSGGVVETVDAASSEYLEPPGQVGSVNIPQM